MISEIMKVVNQIDASADDIIRDIHKLRIEPSADESQRNKAYLFAHRYASMLEKAVEDLEELGANDDDIALAEELAERFGDLSLEVATELKLPLSNLKGD